ncbi:MAG: TonB-dependent receptor plug [Verrucomicrobia bacterium]|nr:TonB-dependent receptor plug [Verrucomicrobiota bacterium]
MGLPLLALIASADDDIHGPVAMVSVESLRKLSIEELLNVEVTTLSRKEERWWTAPGAIDVVTGEDIRRSTAQNLPEALRLASGLDMAQSSARSWAVSTRGFNVLAANKISVVMDGRSLFTPFFSGVEWDAQDVMLEDVERIEVVRGPVGALWGSFAVNGFVQILSKSAADTQGSLVSVATGTEDPGMVSVRYGGKAGPETYYRVYAKYFETDWTYLPNGQRAEPTTDFFQSGFRVDQNAANGTATLQGDVYTNKGLPQDRVQTDVSGGNVLGHWKRSLPSDAEFDVVSYYDHTYRLIPATWKEIRDTASLAIKYRGEYGRHDLLTGFDANFSWDDIAHLSIITMNPAKRLTHTIGLYTQDTISLVRDRAALVVGVKAEHNSFSGVEFEPSLRAVWTPDPRSTLWAAVSRAVRAPVRIDQDLVFGIGNTVILEASDQFKSETVIAYELGLRHQFGDNITFDLATFHNDYRDLRTTEPVGAAALPLTFKNTGRAKSSGAEVTMVYLARPGLSFNLSYRYLDLDFSKLPESRDTGDFSTEANDPMHMLSVGMHADLPGHLEFDAYFRHVGDRPHPVTPGYSTCDLRLGWAISSRWDISLSGRNLFAPKHRELVTGNSLNELIAPSGTLKSTWRF